ncbi:DUF4365 domain-containing protein [uncultured Winogradskyella sp.]|uniref:DUF4365 domain-containing protein n=1 Tax=uncultured Winogradskyella sp. TaxID=395353 RepID=UPI0030D9C1EF|tara:strand:- start:145630 stop:146583 length:954 start_codon:yes stop_codon:yes gene_type:complete
MTKKRYDPIQHIGVNATEKIFLKEFGWITRRILESDMGVDMEVEICVNNNPTGQLIGVQIKTGASYFKTDRFGDVIYRGSQTHLDYWLNHSLPIIIILHNPDDNSTIWQKITSETITNTSKGWKVEIPIKQTLNHKAITEISEMNKFPIYFQRLQRLGIHRKLIERIAKGQQIVLEIEQWANKTAGHAHTKIIKVSEKDNEDKLLSEGGYVHFSPEQDVYTIFPWAEFEIDEEHYNDYDSDEFYSNYGVWDPEEKVYAGTTISWQEYVSGLPRIRYMDTGGGEIYFYRLIFSLNDLGKAFITMNTYLENGNQLKLLI